MASTPVHLRPTAALAERVLLPGDPGRALLLAQTLLDAPRMFNLHRGLWGYTGRAADGEPLTVQSTGMGAPSVAIVVSELADLGARRLIRVGTCGALAAGLELGDLVVAREAIAADGASRALGASERVAPDAELTALLEGDGVRRSGTVVTTDLFYDDEDRAARWAADGALAIEMEAATLFRLATRRGLRAACVLAVSDRLAVASGAAPARADDETLAAASRRLGHAAARALGAR